MLMLKRLARYLIGRTRVVIVYKYQDSHGVVDVWTDTDYAGCQDTRKSTSGGVIIREGHIIKSWAATEGIIALSSGEAEFYSMVKGGSVALGRN